MKIDEIVAIGAIYALLICSGTYFKNDYQQKKQITELTQKYEQARTIAVELHEESKDVKVELETLKKDVEEVQPLIRIKEELRSYTIEEIATGLWVGWTESTWDYNANHQGLYSNFCGNMPWHWDDFLNKRGVNSNSAAACIEIYNYYKEIHGNRYNAIKAYKGIVKNTYIIDRSIHLRNIIYNILLEERKKGHSWLQ